MKLYEIAQVYENLLNDIEAGLIPEEAVKDTLECVELALEEKADNIACIIKNMNAEAAAIKAEEDALAERRRAKEKEAERMQNYLAEMLTIAKVDKLETARNKISFRKTPAKVIIHDEQAFVDWCVANEKDYFLKYSNPTVNKTNVKDAIIKGELLPGAIVKSGVSLQIR